MTKTHQRDWAHCRDRAAAKQDDDAEEGKKKRGGVQVPEEWPWEEAKTLFEKPDVTPADQIDVSLTLLVCWRS